MEQMGPESHELGYVGRQFIAQRMWKAYAARVLLAENRISLQQLIIACRGVPHGTLRQEVVTPPR
jgi:hypothetical protein